MIDIKLSNERLRCRMYEAPIKYIYGILNKKSISFLLLIIQTKKKEHTYMYLYNTVRIVLVVSKSAIL